MRYIIGIDEVGRGALAGPVTVAAVAATVNSKFQIPNSKPKLKDSKKLSPQQREIWFQWIIEYSNILENVGIFYTTASVSPKIIDKINISNAANLAATRALVRLMTNDKRLTTKKFSIFLDGGLFIKRSLVMSRKLLVSTIVRGDEKIPAIMLASIVAKVSRDRKMIKLDKKYPKYGFGQHKGYGTKRHLKAIKKYGRLPIHRESFKIK